MSFRQRTGTKCPRLPWEGEVPNEREAEGFVRQQSMKTPQLRFAQQLPFQGSQGGFAAWGAFDYQGICIFITHPITVK